MKDRILRKTWAYNNKNSQLIVGVFIVIVRLVWD